MRKTARNTGIILIVALVVWAVAYFVSFHEKDSPEQETENVVEDQAAPEELDLTIPAPADVAAMPGDVTLTPEGVGIRVLKPGDNENFPTLNDDVTIHYTGWTTDGEMFDSSVARGQPATFPLGRLIKGWQSAVPKMSKGEKALIWIPGPLAYDYPGAREGTPKGLLVFEIELLDFAPSADTGE